MTGILATKDANPLVAGVADGLLMAQIKAIVITLILAVVATTIIAFLVKAVVGLRPSEEVEVSGLDLAEHGEEGYHSSGSSRL
jgi:Amt family ammonium transporter